MSGYHESFRVEFTELPSVARVSAFLEATRREAPGDFEKFERQLAELMRKVECDLKAAELARYDVDAEVIVVGGKEYRRCLSGGEKTYGSSSGPVTVARNLFRVDGHSKAICPLELRVGIIFGCTPLLARQVAFLMGLMTSDETATVFEEMAVAGPSASTCDRLPKHVNVAWERQREEWEAALRCGEEVPAEAATLACSLDGVLVPDREGQKLAKAAREAAKEKGLGKQPSGPAGYREVGCGTVSLYAPPRDPTSQELEDRVPQRLATVRYARAPEYKKKSLTDQLTAEVEAILGARPDLQLVALADGAEENWRYFDGPQWEHATKIVDIGHACEHLKTGLATYYGTKVEGRAEYEKLKVLLRDKPGGARAVLEELDRLDKELKKEGHPKRRKKLKKERTFFRNQQDRMDYARYQSLGLPIGTGVMEASCKTLATQRMKRSGMTWGDGKQAILTIRSLQQSERWDKGWKLLAASYRHDVIIVRRHGPLRSLTTLAA